MNPLDLPFGKKPKEPQKEKVPSYLGVRNEAVRDDLRAKKKVTIQVGGLKGVAGGQYQLEWVEGQMLGEYLSRLRLKRAAIYAAVRHADKPYLGRLRMTFIPDAGDRITIGNPSVSPASPYQRSNHNAERVARGMGGGARFVEVQLVGKGK